VKVDELLGALDLGSSAESNESSSVSFVTAFVALPLPGLVFYLRSLSDLCRRFLFTFITFDIGGIVS